MARKFVKATGLHNIFNTSGSTLDITSIKESVQSKVNQNSIVFLTASEDAIYGYPDGSKYIWTMNTLYPTNSYDEIIELNEEVIAAIISKLNYTIGFDSSANLVWSEESGLTADTIKAAIELVSMNAGVKINDSSVNVAETWSSLKISGELNNIDIIQINDSSIDSSTVWSSLKVNNEILVSMNALDASLNILDASVKTLDTSIKNDEFVVANAIYTIKNTIGADDNLKVHFEGTQQFQECNSLVDAIYKIDNELVPKDELYNILEALFNSMNYGSGGESGIPIGDFEEVEETEPIESAALEDDELTQ